MVIDIVEAYARTSSLRQRALVAVTALTVFVLTLALGRHYDPTVIAFTALVLCLVVGSAAVFGVAEFNSRRDYRRRMRRMLGNRK